MRHNFWLSFFCLVALFLIDRFFKAWFYLTSGRQSSWLVDIFFWKNTGGVFGSPISNWWLIILGVIGLLFLCYWLWQAWQAQKAWLVFAYGLLIIGGFSNWLDRIKFGGVIDIYHWQLSIFNLADVYLLAGLLIALIIKIKR